MDLDKLHNKLMAVARAEPVSERVPYAFEKRIMAVLAARAPFDLTAWWAKIFWRAALVCVTVSILCGVWSFGMESASESITLETAVFSMAEQVSYNW